MHIMRRLWLLKSRKHSRDMKTNTRNHGSRSEDINSTFKTLHSTKTTNVILSKEKVPAKNKRKMVTAPENSITTAKDVASTMKQMPSQNWRSFMNTQEGNSQPHLRRSKYFTKNEAQVKFSTEMTDIVGIDCEMVGGGDRGRENLLARVSIVNKYGEVLYNTFVKPINNIQVTDYRTKYSGVRPANLATGKDFLEVQQTVANLLKDKIVVGHDLKNDFKVLFLSHPRRKIRDTVKYKPFSMYTNGNPSSKPSLKILADKILDIKIQQGEHDSIEDAKAAVAIYMLHQKEWEKSLRTNKNQKTSKHTHKTSSLLKM